MPRTNKKIYEKSIYRRKGERFRILILQKPFVSVLAPLVMILNDCVV